PLLGPRGVVLGRAAPVSGGLVRVPDTELGSAAMRGGGVGLLPVPLPGGGVSGGVAGVVLGFGLASGLPLASWTICVEACSLMRASELNTRFRRCVSSRL